MVIKVMAVLLTDEKAVTVEVSQALQAGPEVDGFGFWMAQFGLLSQSI